MNKLNFFTVATLILGTLKLLGYVDWSWTWVLEPAALSRSFGHAGQSLVDRFYFWEITGPNWSHIQEKSDGCP